MSALAGVWIAASIAFPQDTLVIDAGNPPAWGETPRLVEELRIGALDGPDETTFGSVVGATVDSTGVLWIADGMADVVRRFGPDGRYLGDVGGPGEGPGEFRNLAKIGRLPDGRVVVWDAFSGGLQYFDLDGSLQARVRDPVGVMVGMGTTESFVIDAHGTAWVATPDVDSGEPARGTPGWRGYGPSGEHRGAIARRGGPGSTGSFNRVGWITIPGGDGVAIRGRTDRFAFHRSLDDGRVVELRRELAPVRYLPDEREEAQRLEELYADRRGVAAVRVPAEKPVWNRLFVDVEGRLWVQRHAEGRPFEWSAAPPRNDLDLPPPPEREWGEEVVFEVIEPHGRYLGRLRFPDSLSLPGLPRTRILHAQGTRVWVRETGAFDEHYVVRYRVEPSRE